MWYGLPATDSPAARLYVAVTPSAARKPLSLPVVSGLGSAFPYVLLLALVVHVAARRLIVKSLPALVTIWRASSRDAALSVAVRWYGLTATDSPAARLYVAVTPSATRKPLPLPVVRGLGSAFPSY